MRVYMVETLGKGGLIHYAYHLCRGLQRVGVDTTLITATDYELADMEHEFTVKPILELWDPRKRSTLPYPLRRLQRVWRGIRYVIQWLRLIVLLRRERPDVILFSEMRFAFEIFFLRWLKKMGFRLADIVHDVQAYELSRGSDAIVKESAQHRQQFNRLYSQFDALFVHDRSNRELFLQLYDIPADHVHEIVHATSELILEIPQEYSPDALRRKLAIPSDQQIVLFFGTLTKYKGVEDLLYAFPAVHRTTKAHLVIAGYPAKDINVDELQALADELGIAPAITWFLDYVPNEWVATLMELSTVVVLPYRAITQSGILQNAYACGKPVIGTRVGGLPDAIQEGKSGLLADPQSPESLAQALNHALQNPTLVIEMGNYAKHLAETRYSWLAVAGIFKGVFEKF